VTNTKNLDDFMQSREDVFASEFSEEMLELQENTCRTMDPTEYSKVSKLYDPGGAGDRIHSFNASEAELRKQQYKKNRKRADWARLPNTFLALTDAIVDRYTFITISCLDSVIILKKG
jgi:hypothetical protein